MASLEERIAKFLEVFSFYGLGAVDETFSGNGLDNGTGYGSGEFGCCAHGTEWGTGRGYGFEDCGAVVFCGSGYSEGEGTGNACFCDDDGHDDPIVPTPGIKTFCSRRVRYVDVGVSHRYPLVFESLHEGVAVVRIVKIDLTLSPPCHLARIGDSFALGKSRELAIDLAARRHVKATTPAPKIEAHWDPDDPNDLPF